MALIKCPECSKEISDTASRCPHCGFQLKEIEGSALFKCADNGGWNTAWIKRTVELIDESTGDVIKTFQMGGVVSLAIKTKMEIKICVHGYIGEPIVTLYPGQSVYVNILLKAGGALGGGVCNAEVVKIGGFGENEGKGSSENNPSVSGGGCYVATCVYGSYDCPQVWTLRRYRDNKLAKTRWGRIFIRVYYAISPTFVKCFGKTKWFKKMWKKKLDKMVEKLQNNGVECSPYKDKDWN